jgi:hypothetical protein
LVILLSARCERRCLRFHEGLLAAAYEPYTPYEVDEIDNVSDEQARNSPDDRERAL